MIVEYKIKLCLAYDKCFDNGQCGKLYRNFQRKLATFSELLSKRYFMDSGFIFPVEWNILDDQILGQTPPTAIVTLQLIGYILIGLLNIAELLLISILPSDRCKPTINFWTNIMWTISMSDLSTVLRVEIRNSAKEQEEALTSSTQKFDTVKTKSQQEVQ
uniref:Uncharacterized protein n=1 Tax=Romanomermis culicivorax TaxID=13658 RepID=A0A915JY87_ROMCU